MNNYIKIHLFKFMLGDKNKMKKKVRKIVSILIMLIGIYELIKGFNAGVLNTILLGIGFCLTGWLSYSDKPRFL